MPRHGPILSPRDLDVSDLRPDEALPVVSGAPRAEIDGRLPGLRDELVRSGWTVSLGEPGSGDPALLAETDLRLDLSALRDVHLLQVACAVEFAGAIAVGFLWPSMGHPGWQGEAITGLAVLGAVGLIALLARVDFVSTVLVVERRPERGVSPGGESHPPPWGHVWARRVWSRNWEVLGDRGGRKVLESRSTPAAVAVVQSARAALTSGEPGAHA
ncbi:MAG: hypothetical protein L3K00_06895 [Thermoplasmata archaeon]|nr:hypothetical protein [Thermoplasmata archaeon]